MGGDKKIDTANWMDSLDGKTRLHDILLPGTHDSAAYKIDTRHKIHIFDHFALSKDAQEPIWPNVKKLFTTMPFTQNWRTTFGDVWEKVWKSTANSIIDMRISRAITGFAAKRFVKTQSLTIQEQLEAGTRLLDFRVMYNEEDKKFYLSHRFIAIPLEEGMEQIAKFQKKHPNEIVTVHIKPDYDHKTTMSRENNHKLLEQLTKYNQHLIPSDLANSTETTLGDVRKSGKNLAIYFQGNIDRNADFPNISINQSKDIWKDTRDPTKLQKEMTREFSQKHNSTNLTFLSGVQTPDEVHIKEYIKPKNAWNSFIDKIYKIFNKTREDTPTKHALKDMAKQSDKVITEVVEHEDTPTKVRGVILDHVGTKGKTATATIISRNLSKFGKHVDSKAKDEPVIAKDQSHTKMTAPAPTRESEKSIIPTTETNKPILGSHSAAVVNGPSERQHERPILGKHSKKATESRGPEERLHRSQ